MIQNANHPGHDEACEWLGDFVLESFSVDQLTNGCAAENDDMPTKAELASAMVAAH